MIYQTVNFNDFVDSFKALRPDNFSYEGLQALFEYLEDLSEDIGEPMELDVIAICCDFAESDIATIRQDYLLSDPEDDDVIQYLQDNTICIALENGNVVYQSF